ncbi:MAG: protein-L-isoaspartate O-methyltransferase family protein [Pseudonocardiaceae bacterium]
MTSIVDRDTWVLTDDGQHVPQTSSPDIIATMLGLLDLHPGMRVLEIGTGSSYSTALLAHAVGSSGHVVSIDVDAALVERARRLHRQAGHNNVTVHVGDGFAGWPEGAPYDRIITWATPPWLARTWAEQAASGAVILTSVKIAEVALANAVLRCHITDGQPQQLSLHPGSMIEMHPEVMTELRLPVRYVDAQYREPSGPYWISGAQLHHDPDAADRLLRTLAAAASPSLPAVLDHDAWHAFKAWLLATHRNRAASAGGPDLWGIGLANPYSIAVIQPDCTVLHAGSEQMLHCLHDAALTWDDTGRPSFDALSPTAHPVTDGWAITASLP